MSHRCVIFTWLPYGKFIVSCLVAGCRFLMGVPSIIKIDMALVSAIAYVVAIVIELRYWGVGLPSKCHAVAANNCLDAGFADTLCPMLVAGEQLDVPIVTLLSSQLVTMFINWVGSKG
jgi:hypothetical protein